MDRIVIRGHGTTADWTMDDQFEVVNMTGLTGYRGGNFKLAVWVQLLISVKYSRLTILCVIKMTILKSVHAALSVDCRLDIELMMTV